MVVVMMMVMVMMMVIIKMMVISMIMIGRICFTVFLISSVSLILMKSYLLIIVNFALRVDSSRIYSLI